MRSHKPLFLFYKKNNNTICIHKIPFLPLQLVYKTPIRTMHEKIEKKRTRAVVFFSVALLLLLAFLFTLRANSFFYIICMQVFPSQMK